MRVIFAVCAFICLTGCGWVRPAPVPVPCPEPPVIKAPVYEPVDTGLPVPEIMRQIIGRFAQCKEYSENLESVVEEYRK